MYLKELTLKGFKSFAQPTVLTFEPGITAIVGPNGSGKSNVVDALAWVMGEQGARSLRGTAMDDVIFAGTSSKPALGRAEVSLTIDNSDHTLNIEYSEVTITRTLFRNSGSQYAINGSTCRLLDVQELLNDAGLGSHMHVIVGQGRLDAILHADPQGHRALIEEAAGIVKHRRRKERALRKLDAARANIQRLDDVLREIHGRMGPLGRQASMSRKADMITARLHDAQARLHADTASHLLQRRTVVIDELTGVRTQLDERKVELAVVLDTMHTAEQQAQETSPQVEHIHAMRRDMDRLLERYRTLATVAHERASKYHDQITAVHEDATIPLRHRVEELTEQIQAQEQTIVAAQLRVDQATTERTHREHELARVRQAVDELQSVLTLQHNKSAQLQQQLATAQAQAQAQQRRVDESVVSQQRAETAVQQAQQRVDELQIEQHSEAQIAQLRDQLNQARDTLARIRAELANAQEHERNIHQRIVAVQAKADAIDDTLTAREEADSQELPSVLHNTPHLLGTLSSYIRVREGYEEVFTLALESLAHAFVVSSTDDIVTALSSSSGHLALISAEDSNTNTTYAIERNGISDAEHNNADSTTNADSTNNINSTNNMDNSDDVVLHNGIHHLCIPASQLITARNDHPQAHTVVRVIQRMLADTCAYIGEGTPSSEMLDSIWQAGWQHILTQRQYWVSPQAVVQGAVSAYSDISLIARRDAALEHITVLEQEYKTAQQASATAQTQVDKARAYVDQLQSQRNELTIHAAQVTAQLTSAQRVLEQAQQELQRTRSTHDQLVQQSTAAQDRLEAVQRAWESFQQGNTSDVDPHKLQHQERTMEQQASDARAQEQQFAQELVQAQDKLASLRRQITMLQDNIQTTERHQRQQQERNARAQAQIQQCAVVERHAHKVLQYIEHDSEQLDQQLRTIQEQHAQYNEHIGALRASQQQLNNSIEVLQRRQSALDLERERIAMEYGQIERAIRTDVGVSVQEAIEQYGPEQPVPCYGKDGAVVLDEMERPRTRQYVREEQEQELEQAQQALTRLGKINPLAVEEYDALQERLNHLQQQREDVIHSRSDLLALIGHLDETIETVFMQAFEETAQAFEDMFTVLFPGGEGHLVLDDMEHPLQAGVHVQARPAGKRVKNLSLLSGGERSLTTLALLFAIFTARPSPFYILDEVEAALDDMNLTRLLHAFEKLRDHAQLLVITHQQRTMALADALVGVTMRADGVSATISQKVTH